MGFFDSLLGMFGVGQPKLEMTLDTPEVKQGGMVNGRIRITGGKRPLPIAAIIVKFKQKKERKTEQGTTTDTNTLAEIELPQGGKEIRPNEVLEFAFSLQAPTVIERVGGDVKGYVISGSADTPGWDPEDQQAIRIGEGLDPMAAEDVTRYHVLEEERSFRHSSVKGDFRLERCAGGFVATWKTALSVRNDDGSPRHRIDGWGKAIAISPDGTKVLTADGHKRVAIFDLATGQMEDEPAQMADWIFDLAWMPDGTLLASSSDKIHVLAPDLTTRATWEQLDGAGFYCGGLLPQPDNTVIVTDSNGGRIVRVALDGTVVAKSTASNPGTIHGTADGALGAIDAHRDILLVDAKLDVVGKFPVPGKQGVRYVGQAEHSSTHFKAMPRLSADGQHLLLQDGSGCLFRLDRKGKPAMQYPRTAIEYVEDTLWLDTERFAALTNDGEVRICALADGKVLYSQQDA